MSVIKEVLKEELVRLERMEKAYLKRISQLPKGTISMKKISGKEYPYLVFRVGKKVNTKYLKVSEQELEELKAQISSRRSCEESLNSIRQDAKFIKAALKKS